MTETTGATLERLTPILSPRSVAVVGATSAPGTVPHDLFANLLRDGFRGTVYPVSPGNRSIGGVRAYKYVLDIPDPVDLAVIVFPSSVVKLALEQCGQKGIKGVVIISAGFREVGEAGVAREAELIEIARRHGISFVGPNCLGLINTDPEVHLNASFARRMPAAGPIGFLSQSGALCTAVLDYAHAKHIGFSKFVSFGNKADVSEIDLMLALADDPATKVILLYLEEMTRGAEFVEAASRVIRESGKPVLVLKSGRTREGASAAASHTGSLASSDDIVDAALRQAGVIRCRTIEEMFNVAIGLAYQPLPTGRRVAIITNAGGPGVLATDAAVHEGLELAAFAPETTDRLRKALPPTANWKNPVDVIGDARADRYRAALSGVLADDGVDGALVILTPQSMTDIDTIAEEVSRVAGAQDKPVYASFMGETDVASGITILQRSGIPHYILPESMGVAYARAHEFAQVRSKTPLPAAGLPAVDRDAARAALDSVGTGPTWLSTPAAERLLAAYGLPVLPSAPASSAAETASAASGIGFPVALKALSADVVHKSEAGAVLLGVVTPDEAAVGFERVRERVRAAVPDAHLNGVLVQRMAEPGEEVILGIKRDPSFGPVVLFGLGGIFVEVLHDVALRIAPLDPDEIRDMIRSVRGWPLLAGVRGREPGDVDAVEDCIARLARLAVECPEVRELDINPLIVHAEGRGCSVADVRVLVDRT